MSKKRAKKGLTFRQRLRVAAGEKLESLREQATVAVIQVTKDHAINALDLMRLATQSQNKSLHYRLVNELVKEKEAELEKIWNDQQKLPLEDKSE
jgi:uncharacterized protein with PIN domain